MNKKVRNLIAQISFLIIVLCLWQYSCTNSETMFPSVTDICEKLVLGINKYQMIEMITHSLILLVEGLTIGIVLALIFSSLSVVSETFFAIYNMIVSMFDLIPGIALTAIAFLIFGLGDGPIIFLVVHSVVWPMSRSVIDGFNAVPDLYLEVGKNIGLSPVRLVFGVFLPAALPRIFSGIKVGWARAWRGLISAEMLFGGAGIGYYINMRRQSADLGGVFAAIIAIIIIGTIVEYGIFRTIENLTFKKWGMSR